MDLIPGKLEFHMVFVKASHRIKGGVKNILVILISQGSLECFLNR